MDNADTRNEFRALVAKTNKQDPAKEDVRALRAFLAKHPEMWRTAGDLAHQAAIQFIQSERAPAVMKESLQKGWDELRDELGYQDASPLERLLIEQAILCWLRHNMLELRYTGMMNESIAIEVANYWNRTLSASQRRYLRACETLARVRKIIRRTPALQINIATAGGQQVNVAGDVTPPSLADDG